MRSALKAFLLFVTNLIVWEFDLSKARARAHILVGLATAVANIDEIIKIIRGSANPKDARENLKSRRWPAKSMEAMLKLIADPRSILHDDGTIQLTDEQAKAILDMRLLKLTQLGMDEITDEVEKLAATITDLLDILRSRERVQTIIRQTYSSGYVPRATPRR